MSDGADYRQQQLSEEQQCFENEQMNPIVNFFKYEHLHPDLQKISKPLAELAYLMNAVLPNGPEKTAGLRKLLEAKDCFVRANLP